MEILATAGILAPSKTGPAAAEKRLFAVVNWRGEDGYSEHEVRNLFWRLVVDKFARSLTRSWGLRSYDGGPVTSGPVTSGPMD